MSRGKLILSVFSGLGWGNLICAIVFLILVRAFEGPMEQNIHHLEWVWRLLLGISIILGSGTVFLRWRMRETEPYMKCMFVNAVLSESVLTI